MSANTAPSTTAARRRTKPERATPTSLAVLLGLDTPPARPARAPVRAVLPMAEPNPACVTPPEQQAQPQSAATRTPKTAGHHRTCADQREAIARYMRDADRPVNRDEVAAATGLRLDTVSTRLQQMAARRIVTTRRDGMSAVWQLAAAAQEGGK